MRSFTILLMVLIALGSFTLALPALDTVTAPQPENACIFGGLLRGVGRAIGVQRRQERRSARQAARGRAC